MDRQEIWSQGEGINTKIVSRKSGATPLTLNDKLRYFVGNITAQQHANIYAEEYNQALQESLDDAESLSDFMDAATVETESTFDRETKLGAQLYQV